MPKPTWATVVAPQISVPQHPQPLCDDAEIDGIADTNFLMWMDFFNAVPMVNMANNRQVLVYTPQWPSLASKQPPRKTLGAVIFQFKWTVPWEMLAKVNGVTTELLSPTSRVAHVRTLLQSMIFASPKIACLFAFVSRNTNPDEMEKNFVVTFEARAMRL